LEHGIGDTMRYIVEKAGFALAYAGEDEETYNKRLNIDELMQSAEEYERENSSSSLSEYLQSVTLSSDTDEILEDNYVSVATVHAVKGLEFPVVYVVGLEENIFPSGAYNKTDVEIEEERRVMYVAMTRAQKKLCMTYCDSRFRFGHYEYNKESRFLTEIEEAMGWHKPVPKKQGWTPTRKEWGTSQSATPTKTTTDIANTDQVYRGNIAATSAAPRPLLNNYRVGDKVKHPKFGIGKVIGIEGDNGTIAFEAVGVKKLSFKIAPLIKLQE
jgi:DNA helicase-2/ATP-dependent DNA helicase PcrA